LIYYNNFFSQNENKCWNILITFPFYFFPYFFIYLQPHTHCLRQIKLIEKKTRQFSLSFIFSTVITNNLCLISFNWVRCGQCTKIARLIMEQIINAFWFLWPNIWIFYGKNFISKFQAALCNHHAVSLLKRSYFSFNKDHYLKVTDNRDHCVTLFILLLLVLPEVITSNGL